MPCLDSIAHKPLQPDMHDYLRGSTAPLKDGRKTERKMLFTTFNGASETAERQQLYTPSESVRSV